MNKVIASSSSAVNNPVTRRRVLDSFRRILQLQRIALKNDKESIREGAKMVKDEYRKNAKLIDEGKIEACLEHANIYIARLEAQTLSAREGVRYNSKEYWEEYYNQENQKAIMDEWYCSYEDLKPYLPPRIERNKSRVLVLGSGISSLGAKILKDFDPKEVVEVDFCQTAIDFMKGLYGDEIKKLRHERMDFRNLPEHFPAGYFDFVIDKAGMDSVVATPPEEVQEEEDEGEEGEEATATGEEDDGDMEEEEEEDPEVYGVDIQKVENGVWHVLKPGGTYFMASVNPPDIAAKVMQCNPWQTKKVGAIEDLIHFYWFVKPPGQQQPAAATNC